jgi:sortase A
MEIILYQAGEKLQNSAFERRTAGWAGVPSSFQKPKFSRFLSVCGSALILFSLLGLGLTYGPLLKQEIAFRLQKPVPKILASGFGQINNQSLAQAVSAPDANFSLVIPKINAASKIIANVDAKNSQAYNAVLKKGIAHAAGTVFPGMNGTIWLFAHSASSPWDIRNYNAVFYLLTKLEKGDEIIVFFEGHKYSYRVTEKKITSPQDTTGFKQRGEEILVLQTCYPPGTVDKALLVFAKPLT